MNAFLYGLFLQWKLDMRNKGIILIYYVVPLLFFGIMGGVFSSINPDSKQMVNCMCFRHPFSYQFSHQFSFNSDTSIA